MKRTVLMAAILAVATAGCAAVNPVSPQGFDTKLLNLYSIGNQVGTQTNYTPNSQVNYTNQGILSNALASFPIASLIGAGGAFATNATAQNIVNNVAQVQNQSQLVL